jgi:SAM-dependent methyltransferase
MFMDRLKQAYISYWDTELKNKSQFIHKEDNIFHDYFRKMPFVKLKQLLDKNDVDLTARTVLVAGCGKGTDVYYLKKFYRPKIHVCDIAEHAVRTTVASFENIRGNVADIEALPFEDDAFDYSFVAASLHHLSRPILGLYELLRVAKFGTIVIEPNDSILTRIAVLLGCAHDVEESGNYVFRFGRKDVIKLTRSLFCDCAITRFFAIHKIAENELSFFLLKCLNGFANAIYPHWGNYIVFVIKKQQKT